MESSEERYRRQMIEVQKKLDEPKMKKYVDKFLDKMTFDLKCDIEINFNVYPEVDDYEKHMESDDFIIPRKVVTMKLGDFIDHISKEDRNFEVFIDPIYMKKGVNEVHDVLTTTINNAVIIVPISTKIDKKEEL